MSSKFDQPVKDLVKARFPHIETGEIQKKPFKQCFLVPNEDIQEFELFLNTHYIKYVKSYLPAQFGMARFREV